MIKIPENIKLANLPTRIEKLENFYKDKNIYIKRDDQTGIELSGNKVRKLEFAIKEAIDKGAKTLITCGAVQSNHARATAAAAKKLGLKCILVLKSDKEVKPEGNYLLDILLGAEIKLISSEAFSNNLENILEEIKIECDQRGEDGYILPIGASNGIGTFGYYKAFKEIIKQEKENDIEFDTIVVTVGSGGTYAGLLLANKVYNTNKKIIGINISNTAKHFENKVKELFIEASEYLEKKINIKDEEVHIIDGYVGRGYGLSTKEEINFIKEFSKKEGIILDPVYTGKAMRGFSKELEKETFKNSKNILFIHTGGIFGLFPSRELF